MFFNVIGFTECIPESISMYIKLLFLWWNHCKICCAILFIDNKWKPENKIMCRCENLPVFKLYYNFCSFILFYICVYVYLLFFIFVLYQVLLFTVCLFAYDFVLFCSNFTCFSHKCDVLWFFRLLTINWFGKQTTFEHKCSKYSMNFDVIFFFLELINIRHLYPTIR